MTPLELVQQPESGKLSPLELVKQQDNPVSPHDLVGHRVTPMDLVQEQPGGNVTLSPMEAAAQNFQMPEDKAGNMIRTGLETAAWPFVQVSKGIRSSARIAAGQAAGETLPVSLKAAQQGFEAGRGVFDETRDILKEGMMHYGATEAGASAAAVLPAFLADLGATAGTIPAIAKGLKTVGGGVKAATEYGAEAVNASKGSSILTPELVRAPGGIEETVMMPTHIPGPKANLAERMLAQADTGIEKGKAVLGKAFVPKYEIKTTLPQADEYLQLADQRLRDINEVYANATDLSKQLAEGLSKDQRTALGVAIRNGGQTSDPLLAERAMKARTLLDTVGQQAVDAGLLSQKVYDANKGAYMARFYEFYENPDQAKNLFYEFTGNQKPNRVLVDRFLKANPNLTSSQKDWLREITDPAYSVAKGLAQTQDAVVTSKFFSKVASNPEWVSPTEVPGWVQMPETAKQGMLTLGDLSGKWVHPALAGDINDTVKASSDLWKWYSKSLSMWKASKTVMNPMTHFGNIIGNIVLSDLGGLSPTRVDIYGRALKEMASGEGPLLAEAKAGGLFGKTFAKNELNTLLKSYISTPGSTMFAKLGPLAESVAGLAQTGASGMAKAYQAEEEFFKYAKFIHNRTELGMTTEQAIADAQKWLFDYSDKTRFIKQAGNVVPFITFPSKALPVIAEAAVQNPMRVSKYILAVNYLQNHALDELHLTQKDWDQIKRTMPGYLRNGQFMLLPSRDAHGNLQFLDVSRIFLYGQGQDIAGSPLQSPLVPMYNILAGLFDEKKGIDWRGQPIYSKNDTPGEKAQKAFHAMYQLILPSLAPPIPGLTSGGYSTDNMMKAIQGQDYHGEPPTMGQAVARQLGVKTVPLNEGRAMRSTVYEFKKQLGDLQQELKQTMIRQDISSQEKESKANVIQKKMRALMARGLLRD